MAAAPSPIAAVDVPNPLLIDFEFPPFDSVKPEHVRPGIRDLLKLLVCLILFLLVA